jgi:hypothetical protein
LQERAKRGSEAKFRRALRKVKSRQPVDSDRL